MLKKLLIVLFISSCFACNKNQQKTGCPVQTCTNVFVSFGIKFKDKDGKAVTVSNYSAFNQHTKQKLVNISSPTIDAMQGYYIVATDNMRDQLSSEGDEILISGTHPTTGQTKTAVVKLSGGCNCHIEKLSGPMVITFD